VKLRENLPCKLLAFVLAVCAFAGAAVLGCYQAFIADALWLDVAPADSDLVRNQEREDFVVEVQTVVYCLEVQAQGLKLGTSQAQDLARGQEALSSENTNLRWQILDSEGEVLYGNTQGSVPVPAQGLYLDTVDLGPEETAETETVWGDWRELLPQAYAAYQGEVWQEELANAVERYRIGQAVLTASELDMVYADADGQTELLMVWDGEREHYFAPTVGACLEANEYGYQYVDGAWEQVETDPRLRQCDAVLWLEDGLPVADQYQRMVHTIQFWQAWRGLLLAANILCALAGVVLTAYLCAGAGHKRGVEGIWLHWFHRIPGDLVLVAFGGGTLTAVAVLVEYGFDYPDQLIWFPLLLVGLACAAAAVLVIGLLVTISARGKAGTLWRNTVIWRLLHLLWRGVRWCGRWLGDLLTAVPLVWKAALAGLAYLALSVIAGVAYRQYWNIRGLLILVWLLVSLGALALLCLWSWQWRRIRQGTKEIVGGHPETQISTERMLPDLKAHAQTLNDLGKAISAAVEEQLKSERFKAELITNVSHDLKTPLTSILNYVDLLKKEDIANETARGYIEVLDRKSQRLKKLTEDLVEASKASTGALTVNRERLDVKQLVEQAAGEYQEKLTAAGLTLVTALPREPVIVTADGRHLWRVLDNLLGNCVKYALEGTRVYLDVTVQGEQAVLTVKNVSRQPLNVPAQQLLERFVRGDESRTTEGSGLGLSIARSLTELQGGEFSLTVDGDLFKAGIALPLSQP
jgi:signal transduction histidine kinase